jgi:uncharacterized protein YjiS (DUF1127 family)
MSTMYVVTDFGQTAAPLRRALRFAQRYWSMLRKWRERDALRSALYGLSDRELQDIGTTHGEIEYVARFRAADPRRV